MIILIRTVRTERTAMRIELARADSVRTGDYIAGYARTVYCKVVGLRRTSPGDVELTYMTTEKGLGHQYHDNSDMILIGRAE